MITGTMRYSAIFGSLALLILVTPALACSWVALTPEVKLERSDLIFTGRVLESEARGLSAIWGLRWRVATLEVYAVWKGELAADDPSALIEIWTGNDSCGAPFAVGEEFLVYARNDAEMDGFVTSGPDGTVRADLRWALYDEYEYEVLGEPLQTVLPSEQAMILKGVRLPLDFGGGLSGHPISSRRNEVSHARGVAACGGFTMVASLTSANQPSVATVPVWRIRKTPPHTPGTRPDDWIN